MSAHRYHLVPAGPPIACLQLYSIFDAESQTVIGYEVWAGNTLVMSSSSWTLAHAFMWRAFEETMRKALGEEWAPLLARAAEEILNTEAVEEEKAHLPTEVRLEPEDDAQEPGLVERRPPVRRR